MLKRLIFSTLGLLFIFSACSQSPANQVIFNAEGYDFPYDLTQVQKKYKLPSQLVEISGLSYYKKKILACVQDEKGNIYLFNLEKGEVEQKIKFGKDGDFEGIEIIGETAWVLKSNGKLYRAKNFSDEEKIKVKKYETELSEKNDTEGLGLDPVNQKLLIACKGYPYLEKKGGKHKKAVYAFDLEEKELGKSPAFTIDLDTIRKYLKYDKISNMGISLLSWLDPSKGDSSFQPSGIATHRVSGNIYIIATVGKLLIVLKPDGNILSIIKMDSAIFKQPEGICFDEAGNLYISNEGKSGKGNILKFGK